jgi:hypothetical protein
MTTTVRVALPGYDAGTDTNLDHFSLYADEDNVLIKQKFGTVGTISAYTGTNTYTHDLGYIPFFAIYAPIDDVSTEEYALVNNQYNPFEVPNIICAATGSNIVVSNFWGSKTISCDIFYDDMSQTGTPSFSESSYVFKAVRPGKSITSTNPNDYIMHSDLNSLKIIKQGTSSITAGTANMEYYIAHGGTTVKPHKHFVFIKYPDGKTAINGMARVQSYDGSYSTTSFVNGTAIGVNAQYGFGTFSGSIAYFLYGQGTVGATPSGPSLLVSKGTLNVGTSDNPDDYNFHSKYQTLKYYTSGSYVMTNKTSTSYGTIAHNLGYTPFFVAFVNDINIYYGTGAYCMVPYYFANSIYPTLLNRDIGAFVYADGTNLYFKTWFDTNAVGTYNFTFYYKIFRNRLGI